MPQRVDTPLYGRPMPHLGSSGGSGRLAGARWKLSASRATAGRGQTRREHRPAAVAVRPEARHGTNPGRAAHEQEDRPLITGALNSHYILILKANQPLALQAAQVLGYDRENGVLARLP
jgi:hypothetical protein